MEAVHDVYVSETFTDHVVEIVDAHAATTRASSWAPARGRGSPWSRAARARALIHGRNYVIPEDLFALAEDVILHRMRLTYEALADGLTGADVLKEILGPYGAACPRLSGNGRGVTSARTTAVAVTRIAGGFRGRPNRTSRHPGLAAVLAGRQAAGRQPELRHGQSPFLGAGVEYVQSRPYQYGDPIKLIDWRVTARTRKVHVKEYEAPKRMPVYLLVDTSASMTISSHPPSKYETAVFLAGGLALACLERISPVGVLGVGGHSLHVRPSLSKDQVLQWLHTLRTFRYDEPTSLGARLARADAEPAAHRVLVIVLSDLHDPASAASAQAAGPAARLRRAAICATRPRTGCAASASSGPARPRPAARSWSAAGCAGSNRRTFADQLKKAGVDYLLIETDEPYVSRVRQFFKLRNLLGRGAR